VSDARTSLGRSATSTIRELYAAVSLTSGTCSYDQGAASDAAGHEPDEDGAIHGPREQAQRRARRRGAVDGRSGHGEHQGAVVGVGGRQLQGHGAGQRCDDCGIVIARGARQ